MLNVFIGASREMISENLKGRQARHVYGAIPFNTQYKSYLTHNKKHQLRNFDVHSTPSTRNRLGS